MSTPDESPIRVVLGDSIVEKVEVKLAMSSGVTPLGVGLRPKMSTLGSFDIHGVPELNNCTGLT